MATLKAKKGQRRIDTDAWNSIVDKVTNNDINSGDITTLAGASTFLSDKIIHPFKASKVTNALKIKIGKISYTGFDIPLKGNDTAWFEDPNGYAVNEDDYKVLDIDSVKFDTDDTFNSYPLTNTVEENGTRELFVVVKVFKDSTSPISPWTSNYNIPELGSNLPDSSVVYLTNAYELAGFKPLDSTIDFDEVGYTTKAIAKIFIYPDGSISKIEQLHNDDIHFTTSAGSSTLDMPFDCTFTTTTSGASAIEKIQVRDGGFYLQENNSSYRFIGYGVDALDADITIFDIEDYNFSHFRELDVPSEPTTADEEKQIIWAGVDTSSVDDECFLEITNANEVPDREVDKLVPIAEIQWSGDGTVESPYTKTINQLKRGFLYIEEEDLENFTFRVAKVGGVDRLQCYIASGNKYNDIFYYNGVSISEDDDSLASGTTPGWLNVNTSSVSLPTVGATTTIYSYIYPISTTSSRDISNPSDMIFRLRDTLVTVYNNWWNYPMILATIKNVGGKYIIYHHRKGTISIESRVGDATNRDALNLGEGAKYKQRSIDVIGGGEDNESFELYGFSSQPTPTASTTDLNIVVSEPNGESSFGANRDVAYLPWSDLRSEIITIIDSEIPPHNSLDGLQGVGTDYYHLSQAQYDTITESIGLSGGFDHGLLDGLLDDDHPQYFKLDGRTGTANEITVVTKITDTTDASFGGTTTGGALNIAGGINAKNMSISDGENYIVNMGEAAAIDVEDGDYYHSGVQGQTITNWTGGGIVTGTSIIEIDASDLQPTDKILVIR